ncbi:hypothetical protein E2C01_077863 [Portunus trituberculatus]|uniref:Uncharacterized protein n=1 Tax=Portunus trituberculatus TaxID=210409 RepID=A0A5B7IN51_PORTR|nr:hypothetical protein [Portunus trituberculatus]
MSPYVFVDTISWPEVTQLSVNFHGSLLNAVPTRSTEVQKEAYDARCHDSGPEDFLRRVPCPKNQLCPDEDNPTHVVSGTQLTYAVQDINSPR